MRGETSLPSPGTSLGTNTCFLCLELCSEKCPHCGEIYFCSEEHLARHRYQDYCLPFTAGTLPGKGRVLFATRDIRPLELVLVDPGTVVGPNYKSEPVCLQCLRTVSGTYRCPQCRFPLCDERCRLGDRHRRECSILATNTTRQDDIVQDNLNKAYSHVTILRMLLLFEENEDKWRRTNQLMDHLEESQVHPGEWKWYQQEIIDVIRRDLRLGARFSEADIKHVIGLLNVNAVCLQFPKTIGAPSTEVGKGCYPIFAIMSHHCVCNARYFVDPVTFQMFVRARVPIRRGEELTVQYLSALQGTHRRCSDPTECGTYISGVKCLECLSGVLLPTQPLEYYSSWSCNKCSLEVDCDKVETIVSQVEQELNTITNSGEFNNYKKFIMEYSDVILHKNHFLLTMARRNLMQYLCYSLSLTDTGKQDDLEYKVQLCQDFYQVLNRIDPGWSELSMFAKRELHFYRLSLLQRDYSLGSIQHCEFSVKSRNSLETLKKIDSQKKMLSFERDFSS